MINIGGSATSLPQSLSKFAQRQNGINRMRYIQKLGGQILISLFLAGSFYAADLQAADTVSIAAQIAKPTKTRC
jgi:hypothetical protein